MHPQVTPGGAPKLEALLVGVELTEGYLRLAPNAKLPPKFHELSVIAEHRECNIFKGRDADKPQLSATRWAGLLRTNLSKWREIAMYPRKLNAILHQVQLAYANLE